MERPKKALAAGVAALAAALAVAGAAFAYTAEDVAASALRGGDESCCASAEEIWCEYRCAQAGEPAAGDGAPAVIELPDCC